MELVSGKEPEIYGPDDEESREDILDAVSGQQDAATLLFFVVVASLLAAFITVVSGAASAARVATVLAVMSALGFVAFLFSVSKSLELTPTTCLGTSWQPGHR